jgi:hypothetical protein
MAARRFNVILRVTRKSHPHKTVAGLSARQVLIQREEYILHDLFGIWYRKTEA